MTSVPKERFVLSFGAMKKILDDEIIESAVLQILGYKQIPGSSNRFRLLLNDGVVLFPYAVLATQLNNLIYNQCLEKYTIFRLKDYAYSQLIANKKVIICLDIEILVPGSEVNEKISEKDINAKTLFSFTDLNADVSPARRSHPAVCFEPRPSTSDVAQNWDTVQSNVEISSLSNAKENTLFSLISSLSPYRSKWTIKARVSYMTPIIHFNNLQRQGHYFSFHLLDKSGEIRATAFNENADRFHKLIELFRIYVISNANVKPAPEFSPVKNDFEITFENYTKIEPCSTYDHSVPMPIFNFKSIRQINLLPVNSYTDVIGICNQISDVSVIVTKSHNKEISKRSILLIDRSKISITVTLWGALAENFTVTGNPVIVIKNAKVTYFTGVTTLNVNSMSMLYVDPNISKAFELKAWFQSLEPTVSQSISFSNFTQTVSQNWKTFAEVFAHDKINIPLYHTTKAIIVDVRKENCMYKACTSPGCLKKVNELDNDLYRCNKCNIDSNTFNWVLLLALQVADFTGSHWVTAFKENAESLIGLSSDEFNQIKTEDRDKYFDVLNKLKLQSFIFTMRSNFEVYNDDTRLKSSILSFSPVESIVYIRKLFTDIKRMCRILSNS